MIKKVEWGLACRVGNNIYLHNQLYKIPLLYKALLKHEKEHTDGYSWKDLKIDLTGQHLKHVRKEYWKFIFRHPKTLVMFLPIWKYDNDFSIDPIMLTFWAIIFFILKTLIIIECIL